MAERQEITVRAELRAGRGKNDARRLRARGMVPLTIYGGEGEPIAAAAPLRELAAILRQIDPIKSRLVHADLRRLVRGQEIEVTVRIELEGEPEGVREGGGVLEQLLREVEIRCRPSIIPDSINVDVSGLGVHEMLHVSDLPVGEDITVLTDPEAAVATVSVVREEEVEAIAPETDAVEPEVIGKGKKEDEE